MIDDALPRLRTRTIDVRVEDLPEREREFIWRCVICGGWIDVRDLAHVEVRREATT